MKRFLIFILIVITAFAVPANATLKYSYKTYLDNLSHAKSGNTTLDPLYLGLYCPYFNEVRFVESSGATYYTKILAGNQSANLTLTLPVNAGTNGYVLSTNGAGVLSWIAAAAGSPAGSDTQLQYNNDGAFGEIATIIWDDTNLEFADDQKVAFGTNADWTLEFDDAVDDQLLFLTAGTGCTAITDPMVEFIVGASPTANQQVFGVAKGTQSSNTALFTLDEDGDGVFAGDLSAVNLVLSGTFTSDITLSTAETITNTTDTEIKFAQNGGEDLILDMDAGTNAVGLKSSTGVDELAMGDVDDLTGVGTIVFDAASASLTTATTGDAQDLTLGITGATNSSLIVSSSGTAADSLQISTSAGGMDITVAGAAANEDLDITSNTSINITANEAAADQIKLSAAGTVAGNAVEVLTTNGAINIAASGAANGDMTVSAEDDLSVTATDDLTLNGGSAGSIINLGTNTQGNVIHIGDNDTTPDTITVGSAKDTTVLAGISTTVGSTGTTSATVIQSGTGDISITSTDDLNIGTNEAAQDITLGNITGATSLALKCGTGNFSLEGVAASTITIGKSDQTGTMKFGESTGALEVDVATGNSNKTVNLGTGTGVSTINVGTGGTGAKTITIGDAADTGTTNIKAGSGGINLTGSVIRTSQQYVQSIANCKVGGTAGWTVGAADNVSLATCPQSQTASTLIVPITVPLKVGYTITAFSINGQIDSAGNGVTLDANLRKHTEAEAGYADASIGGITQISKTADYKVVDAKTGLSEVVAADESYYILITATTGATTDIEIASITLTVSEI